MKHPVKETKQTIWILAIDGDTNTHWMTNFDEYSSAIKNRKGWIDFEFPEAHTVDGLRYLPGPNMGGYLTTITKFEISVKTAGSDEYQLVQEGEWENSSG